MARLDWTYSPLDCADERRDDRNIRAQSRFKDPGKDPNERHQAHRRRHPVLCVAGRGIPFVEGLIQREKGDVVIDYRKGPENVLRELRQALRGQELEYVFDAISEKGSQDNYWPAMDPEKGKVTFVLGGHREDIPLGIEQSTTMAESLWKELTPLGERDRLGMGVGERLWLCLLEIDWELVAGEEVENSSFRGRRWRTLRFGGCFEEAQRRKIERDEVRY